MTIGQMHARERQGTEDELLTALEARCRCVDSFLCCGGNPSEGLKRKFRSSQAEGQRKACGHEQQDEVSE